MVILELPSLNLLAAMVAGYAAVLISRESRNKLLYKMFFCLCQDLLVESSENSDPSRVNFKPADFGDPGARGR